MELNIDKNWTLFLDRDGVINEKRNNDYVKNWAEFVFIKGSIEAISKLTNLFGRIIIVTNQRGVGRGIVSEKELNLIHKKMIDEIHINSGKIDKIYYCPDISDYAKCRKPNLGMAFKAQSDFPEIKFEKSIMVGDSLSDVLFGNRLGMTCIFIDKLNTSSGDKIQNRVGLTFKSLLDFCLTLENTMLNYNN